MLTKDGAIEYSVVRSARKTVGIRVSAAGVTVCAPLQATDAELRRIVESRRAWIEARLAGAKKAQAALRETEPLTREELNALADRARRYFPERTAYYAERMGVTYGRITVRNQRTRWGSCSAKGNLNFNCLLMLAPPEVTDSVIVHELAHRKEMNHSPAFYAAVRAAYPEYDKWNGWLKRNGAALMARMPSAEA